jgi:hypothetical protein
MLHVSDVQDTAFYGWPAIFTRVTSSLCRLQGGSTANPLSVMNFRHHQQSHVLGLRHNTAGGRHTTCMTIILLPYVARTPHTCLFTLITIWNLLQQLTYSSFYTHCVQNRSTQLSYGKGKAIPVNRRWRPIGLWEVEAPTFSRQSTQIGGKVAALRAGRPNFSNRNNSFYSDTGAGFLRVLRFPLPIIPPISPSS